MLLLLVLLLLLTRASSLLPGFSLLPLEGSGSFGVWWWNTAAPTEGCFCLRLLVEFLSASFCRSLLVALSQDTRSSAAEPVQRR